MKKIDAGIFFVLGMLLVFILGIVLNSGWLFIIGLLGLFISLAIELGLFKKKNDDGDSDDDSISYKVNEATIKDNVLYLHKD